MQKTTVDDIIAVLQSNRNLKTGTLYNNEKHVVRVTRVHKFKKNSRSYSFVVSTGKPNYAARQFIDKILKSGGTLPTEAQYTHFPTPRKKK